MKDTEFLELLNLYLDHEITAADAVRLEAEVQSNPERRRVYRDYCQMQKACTLLAKDFSEQPAERKIADFEDRRSAWGPGLLITGGLAVAAASVALVLFNRPVNVPNAGVAMQATTMAETVPVAEKAPVNFNNAPVAPVATEAASVIARTVTVTPRHAELHPMQVTEPLALVNAGTTDAVSQFTTAQQNALAQFEWMKSVQLTPIQQLPLNELRLDARSPLQPASRTYTSGNPVQGSVEMTAFRFQH